MKTGCRRVIPFVLGWLLLSGQALAAMVPGTTIYEGNWFNDTFGTSGSIHVEATIDGSNNATLLVDVGGSVFGGSDPGPVNLTGSLDPVAQVMTVGVTGDPVFGNVSSTMDLANGFFHGSATPSLGSVTFGGVFDDSGFSGGYRIFDNSGVLFAVGHMHASVVPVPSSLLLMLSGVAAFAARIRRRV